MVNISMFEKESYLLIRAVPYVPLFEKFYKVLFQFHLRTKIKFANNFSVIPTSQYQTSSLSVE